MKFLSALAADGTIPDVEGIISSNLSAGFDSLKESVSESMTRQEKILASVQVGITVSCERRYHCRRNDAKSLASLTTVIILC